MAQTFPEIGIKNEAQARREKKRGIWEKHTDAWKIVEECYPEKVSSLRWCREGFAWDRSKTVHDKNALRPRACHEIPQCIPCSIAKGRVKAAKAMDELRIFTPPGQDLRALHLVLTAPIHENGQGWGLKAKQDLRRFFGVVIDTLRDVYGPGIGGIASYQDFGEKPFQKAHPHIDLILNGWRIGAKGIEKVPQLDFGGSARDDFERKYAGRASRFEVDAIAGNWYVGEPMVGHDESWKVVAYSVRELMDFRKLVRGADGMRVGWRDYKDESIDWTRDWKFMEWVAEYQWRVRPDLQNHVHRRFGFMADRKRALAKDMGFVGEAAAHQEGCACRECDDWERVADATKIHPELAAPAWAGPLPA